MIYFLKQRDRFNEKLRMGMHGSKLLGITRTAAQGVIVAEATPLRIYKDVQDAARQNNGYSTLLDTSLCSRVCVGDTNAALKECACARHTLERATNVAKDDWPSDGVYSVHLCVLFPVKCKQGLLNLTHYMCAFIL